MSKTKFTTTEELALEVLGARRRLGEHLWTFSRQAQPALRKLEEKGLVNVLSGSIENTVRASLTKAGVKAAVSTSYQSPLENRVTALETRNGVLAQALRELD